VCRCPGCPDGGLGSGAPVTSQVVAQAAGLVELADGLLGDPELDVDRIVSLPEGLGERAGPGGGVGEQVAALSRSAPSGVKPLPESRVGRPFTGFSSPTRSRAAQAAAASAPAPRESDVVETSSQVRPTTIAPISTPAINGISGEIRRDGMGCEYAVAAIQACTECARSLVFNVCWKVDYDVVDRLRNGSPLRSQRPVLTDDQPTARAITFRLEP
jgi:hypothetical protein